MNYLLDLAGVVLVGAVLWDAFETIVLPRPVRRRFRVSRLLWRLTWQPWSAIAGHMKNKVRREAFLSYYGPLSLIFLLSTWALVLIGGFALLLYGDAIDLIGPDGAVSLGDVFYMSGTNFLTLGIGDVVPHAPFARFLTVLEAGVGFGFLAAVIGYLPVLYQAFSRREVEISLLDERAGSPPSAVELLRRHSDGDPNQLVNDILRSWERWSAELLESHLSYPLLGYFRSQHDNQSWLAALTTILDTCAIVLAGIENVTDRNARLTFAMARHAVVDLSQVFDTPPDYKTQRLSKDDHYVIRRRLLDAGFDIREGPEVAERFAELRSLYEPFVVSLSRHLLCPLPEWVPAAERSDNWQTFAKEHTDALHIV